MDWKSFLYKSKGTTTPYYYHWLPQNFEELFKINPNRLLTSLHYEFDNYYQKFDTLVHCTTFENAAEIFKSGFKPKPVADSSVANRDIQLSTTDGK